MNFQSHPANLRHRSPVGVDAFSDTEFFGTSVNSLSSIITTKQFGQVECKNNNVSALALVLFRPSPLSHFGYLQFSLNQRYPLQKSTIPKICVSFPCLTDSNRRAGSKLQANIIVSLRFFDNLIGDADNFSGLR